MSLLVTFGKPLKRYLDCNASLLTFIINGAIHIHSASRQLLTFTAAGICHGIVVLFLDWTYDIYLLLLLFKKDESSKCQKFGSPKNI